MVPDFKDDERSGVWWWRIIESSTKKLQNRSKWNGAKQDTDDEKDDMLHGTDEIYAENDCQSTTYLFVQLEREDLSEWLFELNHRNVNDFTALNQSDHDLEV